MLCRNTELRYYSVLREDSSPTVPNPYGFHFPLLGAAASSDRGNSNAKNANNNNRANNSNANSLCSCSVRPPRPHKTGASVSADELLHWARLVLLSRACAVGSSGFQTEPGLPQDLPSFLHWATITAIYFIIVCLLFILCYSLSFYGITDFFLMLRWFYFISKLKS